MNIKCRSCGHINPEGKTLCEKCGCDLRYSKAFENIMENEKKDKSLLFDIPNSGNSNTIDEDFLFDTSEEEILETNLEEEEDEYKPISSKQPYPKKESPISKHLEEKEKNIRKIGQLFTLELVELCIFFLILLFSTKIVFSNLEINSENIGASAVVVYIFFNLQSLILTGKPLSFHFTKK